MPLEIEKGHNDQPEGPAMLRRTRQRISASALPAPQHSRTTAHSHRMLIVVRPSWLSAAVAFEWTVPTGTSVTASLAHSASVHGVTTGPIASVPRSNLRDAGVFLSHPVSSTASVFVGGSRTFSGTGIDGASSVSGGFSFRFASPRTRTVTLDGNPVTP